MKPQPGGIELDRAVESITIGSRHRSELGDIDALAASIEESGLLQPPTITPEGVLVCGARRLAAVRKLGWRKVSVWIRSGVSDRLSQLMAEQDENTLHKPLSHREAAALYRELKEVMAEDATRREASTRFSSDNQPGNHGRATVAPPWLGPTGRTRQQAAQMVTGRASYTTLERINELEHLADDPAQPASVREQAREELDAIEAGGSVKAAHHRIREALAHAQEPADSQPDSPVGQDSQRPTTSEAGSTPADTGPARYPVKAFVMTWTELDGWWVHYDPEELARALTPEQLEVFFATVEGTVAFAERLRALHDPDHSHSPRRYLRAL